MNIIPWWVIILFLPLFIVAFFFPDITKGTTKYYQNKKEKQIQFCKENSTLYKSLMRLNSRYQFRIIKQDHNYSYCCSSRSEYDNFDPYDFLGDVAYNDYQKYLTLKDDLAYNCALYQRYSTEFKIILNQIGTKGLGNAKLHCTFRKHLKIYNKEPWRADRQGS